MEFLRSLVDLSHLPDSWRQWVGGLLTVAAAFSVMLFEQDEIAVVYIMLVLIVGAVLISWWENSARKQREKGRAHGRQ